MQENINQKSMTKEKITLSNFILQSKIGSGSFGNVYKVKEKKTGIIYAAKISNRQLDGNSDDLLRDISREIEIISKLNHPNILKFICYSPINFKSKPKPTIITELAINGTLEDIILLAKNDKTKEKITDTLKLKIIYGIASAMAYLHLHNIIHRDLKPENILIDDFLLPKIADFGLSKINDQNEHNLQSSIGSIKGTPIYISPEIWEKTEYTKSCDVYAFAFILFELFTYEKPFQNLKFWDIPIQVSKGNRPEFPTKIPESYQSLIKNCWAQNPLDRPSFEEILFQLKNDKSFITESIKEEDFLKFIKLIEECEISYNNSNTIIDLNYKIDEHGEKLNLKPDLSKNIQMKIIEDFKAYKFPYSKFIKLNENCQNFVEDAEDDAEKQFILGKNLIEGLNNFPQNTQLGIKYLIKSIDNGCIDSKIYYINMLIKGKIIPINLKKAKKLIELHFKNNESLYFLLNGKIMKKSKNLNDAKHYFERSISTGCIESMYEYAKLFLEKESTKNEEKAIQYLKKAIDKQYLKAIFKYGLILIKANNKEEGIRYIKMAADKGFPKAIYHYSRMLQKGNGVELNKEESIRYLQIAADNGYIKALYKLGVELGNNEKEQSIPYLKKASDRGEIKAIYQLGHNLINQMPPNKEGVKYMRIAANGGYINAINEYSYLLIEGQLITADYEEKIRYLKMGIEKGDMNSLITYAVLLIFDKNNTENHKEGMKLFKMLIEQGNRVALTQYIILIDKLDPSEYDQEEAINCLKKAIDSDFPPALYNYAMILKKGKWGVPVNIEESVKYLKRAADKGYSLAIKEYAKMLANGDGIPENKEEATKYFKMNIDNGDIDSAFNYALMLINDLSVPEKLEECIKYLKFAADHNHDISKYLYAKIIKSFKNNYEECIKYLKSAIIKGNTYSMIFYAEMLRTGDGVAVNKEEACKYLKMACDKGNPKAMFKYALMLQSGDGVAINKKEALKYYKMAINEGIEDSTAMLNCALILYEENIPDKLEESAIYFKMAADHGSSYSMHFYARLIENGLYVKHDLNEALKYYKMAYKNGNKNAYDDLIRLGENIQDEKKD